MGRAALSGGVDSSRLAAWAALARAIFGLQRLPEPSGLRRPAVGAARTGGVRPAAGRRGRAAAWDGDARDAPRRATIRDQPQAADALLLPAEARLQRLALALSDDPADTRTLAQWADWIGMAPRTLARHFLAETGLTLSAWQRARLMRALEMLAAGAAVTTVALDLGYDNVSAFIAMFKREHGVTPDATRRAARSRPCAGHSDRTQASEDAAVLRGRRGRAAVLRAGLASSGAGASAVAAGAGAATPALSPVAPSSAAMVSPAVLAALPRRRRGAGSWRRAWRPVSRSPGRRRAGRHRPNHPALPGCRPAHARRRPNAGPARLATAAWTRSRRWRGIRLPLAPARLPRIQHPPTVTRAWPRARRPAPVRGRHPPPHHPAHARRHGGRRACDRGPTGPSCPPAGRRANPARRLAPVRRTLPARRRQRPHPPAARPRRARPGAAPDGHGRCRGTHRCPTFPRGPRPGSRATAPLPAGCRRRGSRSRTR